MVWGSHHGKPNCSLIVCDIRVPYSTSTTGLVVGLDESSGGKVEPPAQPPTPFMYVHCSIFVLVQAMYLHAKHETVGFHFVSQILCTIIYVHCSIYSF